MGDLLPALGHKNPQVKEGTLKFLTRCLATSTQPLPPALVKPVSEALSTLLEDSFAGARDEAAVALGTLMRMVGERPLGPVMDGLADVRKVKVKEAFEKATVKAKAGSGGPPRSAPAAAAPTTKAPPKKPTAKIAASQPAATSPPPSSIAEDEPAPPPLKKAPPARLLTKKAPVNSDASAAPPAVKKAPPAAAAAAAAAAKGSKPSPPAAPGALDTFKFKHTPEDSEALAAELIPSNIATDLADANWKTRLAALEEMTTWVESNPESLDAEVVVRFLGKKGWAEKNFQVCERIERAKSLLTLCLQVSVKLYNILVILAERCPTFGRSSVALSVPHLTEKLGDAKLKKPAGDAMAVFGEKTSLQFVLNQGTARHTFVNTVSLTLLQHMMLSGKLRLPRLSQMLLVGSIQLFVILE